MDGGCSIFQAEVFPIAKAAELLLMSAIFRSDISFFIDSQAAMKALGNPNITSKVVSCCRIELRALTEQHITMCWVPGHYGIMGNKEEDVLAKEGARGKNDIITLSLYTYRNNVRYDDLWKKRWASSATCEQTKLTWDDKSLRNLIF
ncbi:uncharacterized protein LOC142230838 [Haematobia irritans]|uniref:uncharacterized protein LOC142230838 n=1 Tax=Haematobia irritans TaxID=7368 RepID=UPI003F4F63F3